MTDMAKPFTNSPTANPVPDRVRTCRNDGCQLDRLASGDRLGGQECGKTSCLPGHLNPMDQQTKKGQ